MTTVMPREELVRKAVNWVDDERRAQPEKGLAVLLEEAARRFNLSPKDAEFMERFFRENPQ